MKIAILFDGASAFAEFPDQEIMATVDAVADSAASFHPAKAMMISGRRRPSVRSTMFRGSGVAIGSWTENASAAHDPQGQKRSGKKVG